MKINILSGLPIVSSGKIYEIDHFEVLKTYYTEMAVKSILFNLAHRRLKYISKKLVKQLVDKRTTGLKLKSKSAGRHDRYDDCIMG